MRVDEARKLSTFLSIPMPAPLVALVRTQGHFTPPEPNSIREQMKLQRFGKIRSYSHRCREWEMPIPVDEVLLREGWKKKCRSILPKR